MPATRITIALNTNQTQKAPYILPAAASHDPASPSSCRTLVLKSAQSKLRLKKASRVFVAGTGKELLDSQDWKSALRDDVVLLVSAGEEYVGLKKDEATLGSTAQHSNPDCPIILLAHKAPVDSLSVTQLETTACTLPGLVHAVGQPDLHPGTKFPIGSVFVSEGWVHPPLIGGDIGCGMAWYRTRLSRSHVDGDKGRRVAEKLRGLEGAWRSQVERGVWLTEEGGKCYSAGEEWDVALGTIGAGNHFAEVQVVEACDKSGGEDETGLEEDEVVLLVHSGSRGYGGDILKRFITESRISLHEDDPRTKDYLDEHDRACEWARCNRDLIALRFLACLEPGDEAWDLGRNEDSGAALSTEVIQKAKAKLQERKVVDIWHNNVERIPWPPQPPSTPNPRTESLTSATASLSVDLPTPPAQHTYAYIHRKGAAPTHNPRTNTPLPLLPLPGSRGTPTLILRPTFSAATAWGTKNALSLAHGAGRSMSRQKALSSLSQKYKNPEALLQPSGSGSQQQSSKVASSGEEVRGGTWVVCDERQLVWEEAPEAYKDVFAVAEDLVGEGCAVVRGWCRPRVSYKVRNEGR